MFTKLTTVPGLANKGGYEGADSKAVGLSGRVPNHLCFRQARSPENERPATLCHPATVAECQRVATLQIQWLSP
jgi:hypothetical protein